MTEASEYLLAGRRRLPAAKVGEEAEKCLLKGSAY